MMIMALSRVNQVIEQIKTFSQTEKTELLRILLNELLIPINEDHFTKEEIAEIKTAKQEIARGEWVNFDEFRKNLDL
jgi:ribosomal protein L29